jgi:hypothetical protein
VRWGKPPGELKGTTPSPMSGLEGVLWPAIDGGSGPRQRWSLLVARLGKYRWWLPGSGWSAPKLETSRDRGGDCPNPVSEFVIA